MIACNNDGLWNETGATLDFAILPAYYQTLWFRAICASAFLLLLWVAYRLRVRQIAKAMSVRLRRAIGRTHSHRARPPRHISPDHPGQQTGRRCCSKHSTDPSRMRGALDQLSIWLERATEEGRAALNSLRTSTTEANDLADAFRRAIEECRIENAMESSFSVVGETGDASHRSR